MDYPNMLFLESCWTEACPRYILTKPTRAWESMPMNLTGDVRGGSKIFLLLSSLRSMVMQGVTRDIIKMNLRI